MADKAKEAIENLSDDDLRRLHAIGHRERVKTSVDGDPDLIHFADVEALEYLLFFGIPRKDTRIIAHRLLDRFGNLSGVVNASLTDLKSVKDMTDSAARLIKLVVPLSRRCMQANLQSEEYITAPIDAIGKFRSIFAGRRQELLAVACLDLNGRLLHCDILEEGSPSSVRIDIAKIMRHALNNGAVSIVLAHNHPAGSMVPSQSDINATMDLAITARGAGIGLYDHFLFTDEGFVSMYNNGVIAEAYRIYDSLNGTHYAKGIENVHEYNSTHCEYRLCLNEQNHVIAELYNPNDVDFFMKKRKLGDDRSFEKVLQNIRRDRIDISRLF